LSIALKSKIKLQILNQYLTRLGVILKIYIFLRLKLLILHSLKKLQQSNFDNADINSLKNNKKIQLILLKKIQKSIKTVK